jgi:hypothetical protein
MQITSHPKRPVISADGQISGFCIYELMKEKNPTNRNNVLLLLYC